MPGITRLSLLMIGPAMAFGVLQAAKPLRAPAGATIQPPGQTREYVQQPSEWVPFSAHIRRVNAADGFVSVGRFYRSSNGSTRSDTGPSLDQIDTIGIKNIDRVAFYLWSIKLGWSQQPMSLPPDGWTPGLIVFNDAMTRVPERVEGFELIRHDAPPFTVFRAPQLNMFDVMRLIPCQFNTALMCGTWFSNFVVGEQPAELFAPPEGQPIAYNPQPGGIVPHQPRRP
ncbi:MAG: hypothetical protein AB7U25_11550 [Vicinamibacterales bacterium]